MQTQDAKVSTPTPYREIKRFGIRKAFLNRYGIFAVVFAVLLTIIVPRGQGAVLFQLLSLHGVLAGFGFSVFTFAILGGRDEFFISVIIDKRSKAVEAIQNLILHLFWPFVIQLLLIVFCILRILTISVEIPEYLVYAWRFLYASLATHGFLELYFAMRLMFGLAIGRLHHLFKTVAGAPPTDMS